MRVRSFERCNIMAAVFALLAAALLIADIGICSAGNNTFVVGGNQDYPPSGYLQYALHIIYL